MNRRSVLLAIQQGQLDIVPVSSETFFHEYAAAQTGISGLSTGSSIICGLCGAFIMHDSSRSPTGVFQRQLNLPTNAWSTSLFMGRQNSRPATPLQSPGGTLKPTTIYIFRLAADPYGTPQPARSRPVYPLCASGWCLTRLRASCNLWAFVRTGIIEKVWEEVSLVASRRTSASETSSQSEPEKQQENSAPPPRGRFGKLWERASSLGAGVVDKISPMEPEKDRRNEEDAKKLPSPPPEPEEAPPKRFVPPIPSARTRAPISPQLPPRNEHRTEIVTPTIEESIPLQEDSVVLDSQPMITSSEQTTPLIKPPGPEKPEPAVARPTAPVPPPRAPRHPAAADVIRPGTPSAIPLPDSRPSTPIPAERRTSLPPTPTKPDAGRASSPASGPGGAPPPIPRRAPTRVRPVSVSLRQSTPLNQPPINLPEEGKGQAADSSGIINEPTNSIEGTTPSSIIEAVSRPTPEVIEVESRQPDAEIIAKTPSPIEGPGPSPSDDVPPAAGGNRGLVNDQNLVGDKSWEEKTWREVVRLREEMFYARMGIVR